MSIRLTRCTHLFALMFALVAALFAADAGAVLVINLPWIRAAADGHSAELYMELRSSEGATLIAANTFAAASVSFKAPGARSNAVKEIPLPANVAVLLAPDGYRIVLHRLTRPLKLGDHVPVNLTLQSPDGTRQELLVNAEVRRRSVAEDEMQPHQH
jgi:periplasmic copper chaperone A